MMRHLLSLILLFSSIYSYGCRCQIIELSDEIKQTNQIFLGHVIHQTENLYQVEVLKTWKGSPPDIITLFRGDGGCENWSPWESDYYVFFINHKVVNICSRTEPYRDADYIPELEKILGEATLVNPVQKALVDSLEYDRRYVLHVWRFQKEIEEKRANPQPIDTTNVGALRDRMMNTHYKKVDIKDKNVIYHTGWEQVALWQVKSWDSYWRPSRFYLAGEGVKINGKLYDYIFFVEAEHQDRYWTEEFAQEKLKKIMRKVSRRSKRQR